ncbi:hypothetical protein [Streptomyces sp. NBC_01565]|uniref:hypothetical protein n=1 Tax=Streptomyces sp. NBC_01565 TaxID=2975881 RepID=UPI00225489E6|nr:hypothetical protein [Streptomyces sp. NBC_01565]MCX4546450.1 hypothetical protein [Streptomyces sp. NBC_01565]
MNRNTMRIGGVAVLAALALGLGGTAAQAQTAPAAPSATATAQEQQQAARSLATALLNSPVEYSAAERAELQDIANGESVATGKFDGIIKLFQKIPGFARAVGGSLSSFLTWYEKLPWYYKAPLEAAGVAGDLVTIWQAFH